MGWLGRRRGENGAVDHAPGAFAGLRAIEIKVRPDFRRTIVFGALALAFLVTGHDIGGVHAAELRIRLIAYGCALLTAIFGVAASRTAAREVQRIAVARAGNAAGTPLRLFVLLGGYLIAVLAVCDLLGVQLRQVLVGGAITGIVVGLAAQPILGNLFAGLVLLFARPYVPGQQVRVMSGALNGPHQGMIVSAGLLYTVLETKDGPLNIPNSALLASAVGPAPADDEDEDAAAPPAGVSEPALDGAALATVVAGAESGPASERKPPGT
ncbi:mechanosensitive ion channel domain-containing protein [Dactylosporangium sp. CA-052675]|uniref:mechanosensitive ion channel domain-containing protein n=1 Tax=Dactylosporangium sp. CA-052675 TaxID=3239927 RepID=UPI003D8AB60A